jgi:hypothetical protein
MEELAAGSRRLQQEHHHLQHQPFAAAGAEPAAPGMIKDVKPLAKVSHEWLTGAPLEYSFGSLLQGHFRRVQLFSMVFLNFSSIFLVIVEGSQEGCIDC